MGVDAGFLHVQVRCRRKKFTFAISYPDEFLLYIGWNDITYLWPQYDRHFVGQDRRTVHS